MASSATTRATLEGASVDDAVLLGNLMELYIHDLSAMFAFVKLGEDGRYGYPELPSYLSGESSRRAFVIRHDGCVAGFVLVRRGSPASDDPSVLDVAEFFVLRQFRARGIGRSAATLLWNLMPGSWTIRASARNPDAIRFWRDVVARYTEQRGTESERSIGSAEWVVLCFDNSSDVDAG
jgi:predicted acetyltransferase